MPSLVDLVRKYEGFARAVKLSEVVMAEPYICPAGYWTIGYGHLCRPDTPRIDHTEALRLLDLDLAVARGAVCRLVPWASLSVGQIEALTSWVFNLGAGRFRGSTMRSKIIRGELSDVPAEMRRWVYAGGKRLPGLVARREAEVQLWIS